MFEIGVNPPILMHYNCNLKVILVLGLNCILFQRIICSKVYGGNKSIWRLVCHALSILTILPIGKKLVEHKLF
jgi:hypothetical protein